MSDQTNRYAPVGKALRLLEHHAAFFQPQLTQRPLEAYKMMHMIYQRASQVQE